MVSVLQLHLIDRQVEDTHRAVTSQTLMCVSFAHHDGISKEDPWDQMIS